MVMTDPIADLLTRVRNGVAARAEKVDAPYSKMKEGILRIMKEKGFIKDYRVVGEGAHRSLRIYLKYDEEDGTPAILGLERVSKPGRRIYRKAEEIQPVYGGFGVAVVSTSKGLLTDAACREQNLGGEVICRIW